MASADVAGRGRLDGAVSESRRPAFEPHTSGNRRRLGRKGLGEEVSHPSPVPKNGAKTAALPGGDQGAVRRRGSGVAGRRSGRERARPLRYGDFATTRWGVRRSTPPRRNSYAPVATTSRAR